MLIIFKYNEKYQHVHLMFAVAVYALRGHSWGLNQINNGNCDGETDLKRNCELVIIHSLLYKTVNGGHNHPQLTINDYRTCKVRVQA